MQNPNDPGRIDAESPGMEGGSGYDKEVAAALKQFQEGSVQSIRETAGTQMEDSEGFAEAQGAVQSIRESAEPSVDMPREGAMQSMALPAAAPALQQDLHFDDTMNRRANLMGGDITSEENYNAALLGAVAAPVVPAAAIGGASLVGGGLLAAGGETAAGAAVALGGSGLSALTAATSVAPLAVGAGVGALIDKKNPARGAVIGGLGSSVATTLALGGGVTGALTTGGTLALAGGAGLLANRIGNFAGKALGAPKGGAFKNTIVRGFGLPAYIPYRMVRNMLSGGVGNIFGKKNNNR